MVRLSPFASLLASVLLIAPLAAQDEPAPPDLSESERLYGLSLFWQEANYNFAFFDQVPDLDWDATYEAFIPEVLAAESTYEYYRELRRFAALLQDGHTSVNFPRAFRYRESYPWVLVRNVEDRALVVNVGHTLEAEIPINSVIETVDGVPAADHAAGHQLPYVFSSTEHHRWDEALRWVLRGPAEESIEITYVTPDGERWYITSWPTCGDVTTGYHGWRWWWVSCIGGTRWCGGCAAGCMLRQSYVATRG